jgi:hypothetical protein
MQGMFGGFYKLTDNMKTVNRFLKKQEDGLDPIWPGSGALGQPRSSKEGGAGGGDSNLPVGQCCQWRGGTEPVPGKLGRPIN